MKKSLKNVTIGSILMLLLTTTAAVLATIGCIESIIDAGEFFGWQIGYGLIVILLWWVVWLAFEGCKQEYDNV